MYLNEKKEKFKNVVAYAESQVYCAEEGKYQMVSLPEHPYVHESGDITHLLRIFVCESVGNKKNFDRQFNFFIKTRREALKEFCKNIESELLVIQDRVVADLKRQINEIKNKIQASNTMPPPSKIKAKSTPKKRVGKHILKPEEGKLEDPCA